MADTLRNPRTPRRVFSGMTFSTQRVLGVLSASSSPMRFIREPKIRNYLAGAENCTASKAGSSTVRRSI